MAEGSEYKGFVFAVTFILIFSALLTTVPSDYQGLEESPDDLIPIDPSLLSGFADSTYYNRTDFSGGFYEYDFNDKSWIAGSDDTSIQLASKVLYLGIIWLGGLDECKFISSEGVDRGKILTFNEIGNDTETGSERYSLISTETGNSEGSFVVSWNITAYPLAINAWLASELICVHGIGIQDIAGTNILSLLLNLLLLQLPDVPFLVNILLAGALWVSIIYVVWFIIKSMIPLLG